MIVIKIERFTGQYTFNYRMQVIDDFDVIHLLITMELLKSVKEYEILRSYMVPRFFIE